MRAKDELIAEIQDDIECFGENRVVFCWFQDSELYDYSLEPGGKCFDPEELGNLLSILTED